MSATDETPPVSILIVDDVASNLLALESCLQPLGHHLVLASSGEQALSEVLKRDFALILLDVVMPGMDGFETAALIRRRERSRLTPILFLTAADSLPEHVLKGYSVGAVDYIHKPVSTDILRSKVSVFVELHQKSQRLLLLEQREHERRLAAVQEQRNRFFHQSLDMMCVTDLEGRFQEVNPAWESALGFPPEEMARMDVIALVEPEQRPAVREAWERLTATEERVPFECRCRTRDGSYRWLSWHAQAIPRERCVFAVARDITGMKEVIEQMTRHAEELSIINADLEQFAYIAAHDLKEPLRMVSGCVMLLARRYGGQLGPGADELIRYAVDGSTRMHHLIEDLLAYSRLRNEERVQERVDPRQLVEMALFNLRQLIHESGAEVQVGPLPAITAHPAQLQILFQNLIENALKYRSEEAPRVQISADRSEGGWLFSVQDNGIGIKPQHHEKVFRIFQRLHDRSRHQGNGMGLAIVKKIVERHGGRVWLESAPGEGTTVRILLPVNAEDATLAPVASG